MRDIISRGLYIFYPIFHCDLYCRAVQTIYVLTKQGNSSINSAAYNQEWCQIKSTYGNHIMVVKLNCTYSEGNVRVP